MRRQTGLIGEPPHAHPLGWRHVRGGEHSQERRPFWAGPGQGCAYWLGTVGFPSFPLSRFLRQIGSSIRLVDR